MIGLERRKAISELAEILDIPRDLILRALWMLETKKGYSVWSIPKKSGGQRQIQAALWPLNEVQLRIAGLIYPFSISKINHSFVAGRSHKTAVLPHLFARAFFSFDIKDAFPSTKRRLVQSSFHTIGFSKPLADLMTDLICYSPTGKPEDSFLPQGYASSPTVFNLVLKGIDQVLAGFGQKRGYQVTRYVDNFAISTTEKAIPEKERKPAIKIVESLSLANFKVPEEKTSYSEVKGGRVHFEFLGLVIEGFANGERKIEVVEEKLSEYRRTIQEALEKEDFSEKKFREIRGRITYLKGIYRDRSLPGEVAEFYRQYRLMRELIIAAKKGQTSFSI